MPSLEEVQFGERVSALERDIIYIQRDQNLQLKIFGKFEETIEKLQDLTESTNKWIGIHEAKSQLATDQLSEQRDFFMKEIKELHSRITAENVALTNKIEDTKKEILNKIIELENKWEKQNNLHIDDLEPFMLSKYNKFKKTLERWWWMIIGGSFVFGLLTSKIPAITRAISWFLTGN